MSKFAEELKTHFMCNNSFSRKSRLLRDVVEKYAAAGQAANDN
jgi:hypothetical protein